MFIFKKKENKPSPIDDLIESHVSYMKGIEENSDEYAIATVNLKALLEAKATQPELKTLSPDTVAVVIGNLAGILLILGYERANVLTSKSLSLLLKPRS